MDGAGPRDPLPESQRGPERLAEGLLARDDLRVRPSVANATKGAWYTVYTNDAVSGTYRAAVSLRAEADGLLEFRGISADADVKFVRVGAGDAQVSAGTPLGF